MDLDRIKQHIAHGEQGSVRDFSLALRGIFERGSNPSAGNVSVKAYPPGDIPADNLQNVLESLSQRTLLFVTTFNSVADMREWPGLRPGMKVRTLGYYSPGDGGGNDYEIVAAGTGTDDGGSFIDLSGSGLQAKSLNTNSANVKQFGAKGDGVNIDTMFIRAAYDYALAQVQSTGSFSVFWPKGKYLVDDELLSDDFQEKWWNQDNLGKQKFLSTYGVAGGDTEIVVSSSFQSAVRNTANGNQRTYGPWANSPSPACLFCAIAGGSGGTPAAFNMYGLRIKGNSIPGKDPIPFLVMDELDANVHNLHVVGFANWGEVIMGSYNSIRFNNQWEGNGIQPVDSGSVLGGAAGFPISRVEFDFDASTNTISAKANSAFQEYSAGDPVPFFHTRHIGKTLVVDRAASVGGVGQPLKATIATVSGDGVSSATLSAPAGVTTRNRTGTAASFLPVKATTTAGNTSITLSSPVLVGAGASDMVGQLIALPKARSTANGGQDVLITRIASCDIGNDTDGYTGITVTDAPASSVTCDFIYSSAHAVINDETSLAAGRDKALNDTDFIHCRWEKSGGFGGSVHAAAYQFICQNASGAVQYVSCKIHGANTVRGQFAADGQAIIDNATGVHLIGCDFTHMVATGTGTIRVMGANGRAHLSNCAIGSWQLPYDWCAFYIDPQDGYNLNNWSFLETGTQIENNYFPNGNQTFWGQSPGISNYTRHQLTTNRHRAGENVTLLTSDDDLNNVSIPGLYVWTDSVPINAPEVNPNHSAMQVISNRDAAFVTQKIQDINNSVSYVRNYSGGSWGVWRRSSLLFTTNDNLADITKPINSWGKHRGASAFSTTDNKMYIAQGPSPEDDWISVDGANTITPS